MDNEEMQVELYKTKIEVLRLKRHLLAVENDAMRLRIKQNAEHRRKLKKEITRMHGELNPPLPF